MMETVAVAARRSWLQEWLRYDESRVEQVEEAYTQFALQSRMGLALLLGVVFGIICGMAVALSHLGQRPQTYSGTMLVMVMVPFYGIPLMAALRVDRPILRTVLCGIVDPVRASIFAAALACVIVPAELAIMSGLLALHTKAPAQTFSPMAGGVAFGLFLLVIAAPVVEELIVQGWAQTKARRFGPRGAGVVATIFFVILHVPTTLLELVRAIGLGAAAWLRGTTRSLAACMVLHATGNLMFGLLIIWSFHQHARHVGMHG